MDTHTKTGREITNIIVFRKKLLKFLLGALVAKGQIYQSDLFTLTSANKKSIHTEYRTAVLFLQNFEK